MEKQYYLGRPQWHSATNPPTVGQLQLLVERVQAVRAVSISKPKRMRLAWFDFAPSVLIVLGLLVGLVSIVASAQLGLLRSPTPIPIAVAASATPTQTRTLIPSRAIPSSAADQARTFAVPILAAIANKPPNFQDDFSNQGGGWKFFGQDQPGYIDGEFSVIAPPAATSSEYSCSGASSPRLPEFPDLLLEIDGRAVLSSQGGDWQAQFRVGQNGVSYALRIGQGYLILLRNESQQTRIFSPEYALQQPSDWNRVQIIAKGSRIAISANGEPIALVVDPQPLQGGGVSLVVCNNSSTQAEGRFDNLKIWDISDLPSPP